MKFLLFEKNQELKSGRGNGRGNENRTQKSFSSLLIASYFV